MPPDSPGFGVPSAHKLFFPCVHLQNLMLLCRPLVSHGLRNQCPRMEKETLVLEGVGGGGGGCILKIVIAKGVLFSYVIIIIIIFFSGGGGQSFDTPHITQHSWRGALCDDP